jgi:hypothetical protein
MWIDHPKVLRVWQRYVARSITLEGELTWWSGNDRTHRTRKLDCATALGMASLLLALWPCRAPRGIEQVALLHHL